MILFSLNKSAVFYRILVKPEHERKRAAFTERNVE